ncbi:MAG: peptide ABC transporter substrate-binding protein [Bdellovibrionales bacterium]
MNSIFTKFIVVVLSFSLLNCTKKKSASQSLESNHMVVRLETEPPALDPAKQVDHVSIVPMQNLSEGLMMLDKEMRPVPGLAESYEVSDDAMTYTFNLRKGVKWSDGTELTASDFVYAWRRMLDPKVAAEYSYFLYDIVNAEEYNTGKIKDPKKVGVKAEGKYTIVVKLRSPASYWLNIPAFVVTYPVRQDIVEQFGNAWTEAGNMPSVGPYILTEWKHDTRLVMERNPNYYGTKPSIAKVTLQIITEDATAVSLYEAGKLDFMRKIPGQDAEKFEKLGKLKRVPYLRGYYYAFNTTKKPFDNDKVRKAFAYAVNRSVFPKILKGGQLPSSSWVPKGLFAYNSEIGIKYNPEKAKKLLAEAGYPGGKDFPRLEMAFDSRDFNKPVAEALQAMWKTTLGVSLEIVSMEWKVYLKAMREDASPIYRLGWGADFPDPHNFMDLFLSTSGNNYTRWNNPDYDKLIAQGSKEKQSSVRKEIYDSAQRILLEKDTVIIPLFNETLNFMVSERVKSYHVNNMGDINFKRFELK